MGSVLLRNVLRARPAAAGFAVPTCRGRNTARGMAASVRLLREVASVRRSTSWLAILLVGGAALAVWIFFKKTSPPEVDFTKVIRETMISSLATNGKVDPVEWMPVRAERAGVITRVVVSRGQQVKAGTPMVELDTRVANAELARAQAGIKEAQTQEQVLDQGERIAERQQVEADLSRSRLDLEAANKRYQALERLVAKQAATRVELDTVRQTIDQLHLRIQALEERKAALVTAPDKEIARAKLQQAESVAAIARTNLAVSIVRAPMDGTVYDFDLRQGSFVNPGDLIGKVGRMDRVRVIVYVDEPDLGKVRKGESGTISWQALPGHQCKSVLV